MYWVLCSGSAVSCELWCVCYVKEDDTEMSMEESLDKNEQLQLVSWEPEGR